MKSEGLLQFVKFGLVGVANTAVDWAVYGLLSHYIFTASGGEQISKAISFIVAVTNSFIWNTVWTFKKEYKNVSTGKGSKVGKNSTIFLKFMIISLVGWGINYYTFKYTRVSLAQGQIVSLIAASGAAVVWNFFGNKLWTYKK